MTKRSRCSRPSEINWNMDSLDSNFSTLPSDTGSEDYRDSHHTSSVNVTSTSEVVMPDEQSTPGTVNVKCSNCLPRAILDTSTKCVSANPDAIVTSSEYSTISNMDPSSSNQEGDNEVTSTSHPDEIPKSNPLLKQHSADSTCDDSSTLVALTTDGVCQFDGESSHLIKEYILSMQSIIVKLESDFA